jgi:endonuclease-3 related protein
MRNLLNGYYKKLYAHFGPQYWWPGGTGFEVMVGAILTQNTNWQNVEKAIGNLKRKKVLNFRSLNRLSGKKLAKFIRPAGYYNVKAERLKFFLRFLAESYEGSLRKMMQEDAAVLREKLLNVKGIGKETADSILLYALNKPVFVIDAYTKRVLSRHGLLKHEAGYDEAQELFTKNLKQDAGLFNEFHALLVRLGKEFCLKKRPRCEECPLK